jgi:flagellin
MPVLENERISPMSISIQTNVNALVAQQNLSVNSAFQSRTIQRLTSGYRINSSSDDAAGLAVANKFRSDTAELTQGVRNANDGVGQLQIMDGGLSNISTMLDRLKTLATQSASGTFTGDRGTLNNEYQSLLGEIDRQASNIGLNAGGNFNRTIQVYTGGGSNQTNAQVNVDLSGSANQVDSHGLGLSGSTIAAAGTELGTNTVALNNTAGNFSSNQTFTFNVQGNPNAVTVNYTGTTGDGTAALANMIAGLQPAGLGSITASMASDGTLQFSGGVAFSVKAGAAANGIATANSSANVNSGLYAYDGAYTGGSITGGTETVTFTNANGAATVNMTMGNSGTLGGAISTLNSQLNAIGIYAVADTAGGLTLQSSSTFSINKTSAATAGSVIAGAVGSVALTNATPQTAGASADAAITSVENAVKQLGLVQGKIGAGENMLNYAIGLAQSQITNFSAAESQIRDADIASEAANLTKASVLQQASIAAMAQANSAPQAVLSLLRG